MRYTILVYLFIFATCLMSAASARATCKVSVSVPPQKFLVERIGGPEVTVCSILSAGANPLSHNVRLDDVHNASGSTIYFTLGFAFEKQLIRMLVNRCDGLWVIPAYEGMRHRNKGVAQQVGQGRARGRNPHVWMCPDNVRCMIEVIARRLSEEMPEKKAFFRHNAELLDADVERLDQEIQRRLDGLPENQRFLLDLTPNWHYFTAHYGLKVYYPSRSDAAASNEGLAACVSLCRENGIRTVLAPPGYPAALARALAQAINGKVILIDPMENNWFDTLNRTSAALLTPMK